MRMRKAIGAIIKVADKYLLVNKIKNSDVDVKLQESEWDFVKGGIKEGESAKDALMRELYEELGCDDFKITKQLTTPLFFEFRGRQKNKKYDNQVTYFYLVEYEGDIKKINFNNEELMGIELLNSEEIVQKLTHDETREYFRQYIMKEGL